MKNLITVLIFTFSINISFSQTGPGGIGNSTTNPYWIDVHTNGGTNGGVVSSLIDYSGNGADAVQADVNLQPVYLANAINGVSALSFDGTDCMISGANSALDGNQFLNCYLFGNITDNSYLSIPLNLDYGDAGIVDAFTGIITQNNATQVYGRRAGGAIVRANFGTSLGYNLFQSTFINSTNRLNASLNFSQTGSVSTASATTPANNQGVWLGGKSNAYKMTGFISEVFVFNTALNTAEENILQNYISAKYGTIIGNDMYAYELNYGFGVVGIGQDDVLNNHLSSQGNGVVSITSPIINNGDYLFIGHDDVSLSSMAFDVPLSMGGASRFARVWRADETSDIGTITLTFDLNAETDFSSNPNNYRLLIDHTDSDFSTVDLILTGTYNAGNNSITFNNVDLSTGDFFTLAGDSPQNITSISSGLWSQPTTWDCSCVPSSFDDVAIAPGNDVVLDVNSNITYLTVKANASVIWNSTEDLEISGDFNLSGTIDMGGSGEISFVGEGAQIIDLGNSSVNFMNVDISNTGTGVTVLNGSFILDGTLYPNSGGMDISSTNFIVNSTSITTTGRIGQLAGGFIFTGEATVRRFIPAGNADIRNLSSPLIGATLSDWDAGIEISGEGFPDGCAYGPDGCYYSVKQYESGAYSDIIDINTVLAEGEGYEVFIGTDLNSFIGATISSKGTIRNENDFVKFVPKNGYSIQGNPFASPILFSSIERQPNIGNYFYIYDAVTGAYQWYDGESNTSSTSDLSGGIIAIGQGYWMFNSNNATAYTITYSQSNKTSGKATFVRSSNIDESIYLSMREDNTTYKSKICVGFSDIASDYYDTLDIVHLSTGLEKASALKIYTSEQMLAKQNLFNDKRDKNIDLVINILNEGYFTINGDNLENFKEYDYVTLVDKNTGDIIDLKNQLGYTFYSLQGEFERFQLIFSNDRFVNNATSTFETKELSDEVSIYQSGKSINIESNKSIIGDSKVSVFNLLGQDVIYSNKIEIIKGSNIVFMPSELSGVFLVVVKTVNGTVTKKIIL